MTTSQQHTRLSGSVKGGKDAVPAGSSSRLRSWLAKYPRNDAAGVTVLASLIAFGLTALGVTAWSQTPAPTADKIFADRVAPILQKHCIACHNPDKSKGSLDLSTRDALLEGGANGPAVVPGESAKSLLAQFVKGPTPKMPRNSDPLSAADVDALVRWIDTGAAWPKELSLHKSVAKNTEPWWAVQPLASPALPKVSDEAWCKSPIDRFVMAKLDEKGMKPSPAADRRTFIRRITFDLTGLPPTPEEVDAFINDNSDKAFERLVDRLLESDAYGERWARIWLDLVHYADTHGFDKDKRRLFAWLYRDWVVRAFNRDLPYRRFVQYQLAGDVLHPNDPEGVIATGFVVAGPWDFVGQVELREGTVDKEKTRALDRDDMVSNAMATFNSLSVHCARCHDHKFDPIPSKDYYRLQAVFAGVERADRPVNTADVAAHKAALEKQRLTAAQRHDALLSRAAGKSSPELEKMAAEIAGLRKDLALLPKPAASKPSPSNGYHSGIESTADKLKWVQVDLGSALPIDVVRLVPARPTDFVDTPGFGFPLRFRIEVSNDATFQMKETIADHTLADFTNPGESPQTFSAQGKSARYIRVTAPKLWQRTNDYVFALGELQALSGGKNVALGAKVTGLDSIEGGRWSKRFLVDNFDSHKSLPGIDEPDQKNRLAIESRLAILEGERNRLIDSLLSPEEKKGIVAAAKEMQALDEQIRAARETARVYAAVPIVPRPIHILNRGDVERKGAVVTPGSLGLFPDLAHHFDNLPEKVEGPRRAALAKWLTDDKNVLTWRSIVNRVWQSHFGRGLVDTPNDFGKNGSRPTHPELLDFLAADFRDNGDSMKRLHRMIVLSATYRQASTHNAEHAKIDGDNRYLWRMNRQRLDAESLRDASLAVAGKLDRKMYGPGYNLFRFKEDHSPTYDHLDTKHLDDALTYRRTIYRFVPRSVPNPFLETLDCADPNISVPVRNTTLTALQALALLNDPFMIRQSEHFASRLKSEVDAEKQVALAYRLALSRSPTVEETTALAAYVRRHGLANACRVILNANEFLFVD